MDIPLMIACLLRRHETLPAELIPRQAIDVSLPISGGRDGKRPTDLNQPTRRLWPEIADTGATEVMRTFIASIAVYVRRELFNHALILVNAAETDKWINAYVIGGFITGEGQTDRKGQTMLHLNIVSRLGLVGWVLSAGIAGMALVAFAALVPHQAVAKPEFAAQTKLPCGQCHVNPAGGGTLKPFGQKFKANGFKLK